MPRPNTQGFNKEKLFFLLGAAAFAWLLYYFLASAPALLTVEQPIGPQPPPALLASLNEDIQRDVEYYVSGPNRQRKTPFAPAGSNYAEKPKPKPDPKNLPPPPPTDVPKTPDLAKKSFDPKDLDVQVSFMGVMMYNGETYALLRPKDGSSPRRVKVGDTLADYKYTVTAIEKQAIWLVDEEKRPFILRDNDEVAAATPSSNTPPDAPGPGPKNTPPKPGPSPKLTPKQPQPGPSQPPNADQPPGKKDHGDKPRRTRQPRPGVTGG